MTINFLKILTYSIFFHKDTTSKIMKCDICYNGIKFINYAIKYEGNLN